MPVPRRRERLSAAEARRVALAAQGFAEPPLGREAAPARCAARMVERVGLLQIDSVNVLAARALPARLQPPRRLRHRRCSTALSHYAPRRLFEYWGHEASLLPVALQPHAALADGPRADDDAWGGMRRVAARAAGARRAGARDGPRARADRRARELPTHDAPRATTGPWWDWSDVKRALEFLFWSGRGHVGARRRGFERLYDLPERVLPAEVLDAPTPADRRGPARAGARSPRARWASPPSATCATTSGCRPPRRKARVAELVEAGELLPGRGRGLERRRPTCDPAARVPRARATPRALVGPFDSLIWERAARRAAVRLPLPDRDLRARRRSACTATTCCRSCSATGSSRGSTSRPTAQAGVLRVQAAHAEPDAPPETTAEALARRARRAWRAGSGSTAWWSTPRGDLAPALRGYFASARR